MTLALQQMSKLVQGEAHLADIDLTLEPGRLYVLLGPTSAGKTSLMRLMAGLDRPSSGRIVENGVDVTGKAPQRRRVAMVYQQFVNYPSLTVLDNIASPMRRQGIAATEVERRARAIAATLRIDHLLDRLPAALSGGQQQRCAIARALAKDASLLIMDEPLVNLDYKLREELRVELKSLFQKRGSIVVYATTEPQEALVMGGEVVVMDEGRVLQAGAMLDVFREPASTRVAEVFGDPPMNMVDGRLDAAGASLAEGIRLPRGPQMAGLEAGSYRFGVRAPHLRIARASSDAGPAPGIAPEATAGIPGTVELAEISGSETFVHVRHGAVSWVVQCEGVQDFALGEPVTLGLDPAYVYVYGADGKLRAAPAALPARA